MTREQFDNLGVCIGDRVVIDFKHDKSGGCLPVLKGEINKLPGEYNEGWIGLNSESTDKEGIVHKHDYAIFLSPVATIERVV